MQGIQWTPNFAGSCWMSVAESTPRWPTGQVGAERGELGKGQHFRESTPFFWPRLCTTGNRPGEIHPKRGRLSWPPALDGFRPRPTGISSQQYPSAGHPVAVLNACHVRLRWRLCGLGKVCGLAGRYYETARWADRTGTRGPDQSPRRIGLFARWTEIEPRRALPWPM